MVPLYPFRLLAIVIYRRSFTFLSTVLEDLVEWSVRSAKRAESFRAKASKKDVLSEVSNNDRLKAYLR